MKKQYWCWLCICCLFACFSCNGKMDTAAYWQADSLNHEAYKVRYKNLDLSEQLAQDALRVGETFADMKAKSLNNLGFCAFIRMDFERADSLLREVYRTTANELECLVADVGMMKIFQRTSMNKEFYDYRHSALRRMKRIEEDEAALSNPDILHRYNYACSEFSITSAIYYYYLQQERQSLDAIDEIDVNKELEDDTAQLLYYYYMKGSGGMYEADSSEDVVVGEFDYLLDCLTLSKEQGYIYFEANAAQAMAELLKDKQNFLLLMERRPGMMRVINRGDLSWEELILSFSQYALKLFNQYGDWYQISVSYRTMASCYTAQGRYEEALDYLSEALSYVNLHHEKYYHCQDTIDRLKPYVPMATHSIELKWINNEGIRTVPEWIARFREQLSVTYAALGLKPQSDYNRNIYLDILDYTRQDKELESRYWALEKESDMLNAMLFVVVTGFVLLVLLFVLLNRRWRIRYGESVRKLKEALDICRLITASVPSDAEDVEAVVESVAGTVSGKVLALVGASSMEICLEGEEAPEAPEGICTAFPLKTSDNQQLGTWKIYTDFPLKKDDKALLGIIVPYLSWTIGNGQTLVSLGDEYRRIEKEQYVHEQHLVENKRQNLVKKACLFIVTGITPYIDRIVNEVSKLVSFNYLSRPEIKHSKYNYLEELIVRINEYNDILALWIKMRHGALSLNIGNFALNELFDVLRKGSKNFELKKQRLSVEPTDAVLKADKALTLFMLNTLMENARKYTQAGGEVKVYAREEEDYVEISVCDNGPGLSPEDVRCVLDEKIYDSGKIGMHTTTDADELQKNKGSGFGLMNCKGIIEKYRKTNALFRVCTFHIESRLGEGSRFYFRLPKGIRRTVGLLYLLLFPAFYGCGDRTSAPLKVEMDSLSVDPVMTDSLLGTANYYANRVYDANLNGWYQDALLYADSALMCLNSHYSKYSSRDLPKLELVGEGSSAELVWFADRFDTDYYTLLDVRNESAVAFLALGNLEAYRYNNQAYTSLYKQISVDASLEEYCERMKLSSNNKIVAIILCIALLVALLVGYYLLYLRHRLAYRYNLEQVLEINKRALEVPLAEYGDEKQVASLLVGGLFREINELLPVDVLGMAIYSDERHGLEYAFSASDEEGMKEELEKCYASSSLVWSAEKRTRCLPLCVEIGEERQCVGAMGFRYASGNEQEEDRLMLELVANYVAIVVYNAVRLVAQKYRDIELAQDEARRVVREENQLHVQNMVLDNCLSTIKHETIYYPNRIKQIVDKLNAGGLSETEERKQVETIGDLICYYKDIFTILSSCAARQLDEVTFRRGVVHAKDLEQAVLRHFKKVTRKSSFRPEFVTVVDDVRMTGDAIQLKYLLENLINEAMDYSGEGTLELHIYKEGQFVRFDFIDRRREFDQEELNQLFYPHLSRMQHDGEGVLVGTEYLICKQIIRDHDEYAGRRGCRMNASQAAGGGFMVWCTVPAR